MPTPKKITEEEWKDFIEPEMSHILTKPERDVFRSTFYPDLKDIDPEDIRIFGRQTPGISPDELAHRMADLRDPNSEINKTVKRVLGKPFTDEKLDQLESTLRQAADKNKERWF